MTNITLYQPDPIEQRILMAASKGSKIKELTDEQLQTAVASYLEGIRKDIGITRPIDSHQVKSFIRIVRAYYFNMSMIEIRTAFEFLCVGLLQEYLPDDFHHYNDFSTMYFSKVINAYKRAKNKVEIKVRLALPQGEVSEQKKQELKTGYTNYLLDLCDRAASKSLKYTDGASYNINELEKLGLIKMREVTAEEIEIAKADIENDFSARDTIGVLMQKIDAFATTRAKNYRNRMLLIEMVQLNTLEKCKEVISSQS